MNNRYLYRCYQCGETQKIVSEYSAARLECPTSLCEVNEQKGTMILLAVFEPGKERKRERQQ